MIGQTISHYKILSTLGAGGMGVAYKAEDLKLKRTVALKFLPPELTRDKSAKTRFIHEAQAASALQHHNICTIHEIEETKDGRLFIAMDCYEGETLKDKISRGPLAIPEAVNIALQIADGLSDAHRAGMVHRDIKPANIIITQSGVVKILDFGLAKLAGMTKVTKTGTTVGTVAYMSPEQAMGRDLDARSDLWSLGVLLYEMLAGALPFRGDHEQAVIYQIVNGDPEPLTTVRTGVPVEIERIIGECMAKKPDDRYANAQDLAVDLKALKYEVEAGRATPRSLAAQSGGKQSVKKLLVPAAIIALIAVAFFVLRPVIFGGGPVAAPKPIAVITFTNQTGDPSYDYLQEVIPNLLITSLEQSKYLSVVTWERLHDLLDQMGKEDVKLIDKEIGFELCRKDGIDTIVLGSYSKAGDVFVTDVKVLDVRTKELLKSASTRGNGVGSILQSQIDNLGHQISRAAGLSERKVKESPAKPIAEVTTTSIEAYNYFLRGRDEHDKLYFDNARRFLEKAVELDSTFAVARLFLGRAYNGLKVVNAAKREFEKAMALSQTVPEKERLYIEDQYALFIQQDPEKRGRILRELVAKYPKEKQAHFWLANDLNSKQLFAEAERECNEALELDPDYGVALCELGYVFTNKREYEKAIGYFERYASVSPGDANPFDSMGEMYFRMGKLDEAIAKYKEALDVKPDFSISGRWLAYIYGLKEDYTGAMRSLDELIALAPSPGLKAEGYGLKGFYCMWVGNWDESLDLYRIGEELYESNGDNVREGGVIWGRGWTYYMRGDFESARRDLAEGADLFAPFWYSLRRRLEVSVHQRAATVLLDLKDGRLDSAEKGLAGVDSLVHEVELVDTTEIWRVSVRNLSSLVKFEVWLAADREERTSWPILERTPFGPPPVSADNLIVLNLPAERDVLARYYGKIGATDKAIAEYERLVTFDPQSTDRRLIYPRYHYRLARLYEDKGRVPEAVAQYQKFLDICGGADKGMTEVPDARARLARLLARQNSTFSQ
jgi:serine/threonine protein kinase/tetratricopeptide (TPR) repeat protein